MSEVEPKRTLYGRVALPGGRFRWDFGRAIGTASMDLGGVQRAYNKAFLGEQSERSYRGTKKRVLDLARLEPGRQAYKSCAWR